MFKFFIFLNLNNIFYFIFYYLILSLFFFIFILLTIALFTVVERKIMAALQKRKGPNVHGFWGSLQAFADGLKLLLKEDIVPSNANYIIFRLAPIYTFFISLFSWAIIPFSFLDSYAYLNIGIIYLFALSSLGVYGIILSGWASNSKYSFLGSLRSAAQMISYEVSIGFILICIILISNSFNIIKIVEDQYFLWNIFPFFPLFFLFFVSVIAETNRAPFDLPEAEAELVSGYNVEYGAISFALFFLAEYGNILLMSSLTVLFFFGGWNPPLFFFGVTLYLYNIFGSIIYFFWFSLKVQFILGLFVWIRVAFPRYRYDQLMYLGWKVFLPFSVFYLFIFFLIFVEFDIFPTSYSLSKVLYCFLDMDKIQHIEDENVREAMIRRLTLFNNDLIASVIPPEGKDIFEPIFDKPENVKYRFDHDHSCVIWQKFYYLDYLWKYKGDKFYSLIDDSLNSFTSQDYKQFSIVFIEFLQFSIDRQLNYDLIEKELKLIFFNSNILDELWFLLWKIHNHYYDINSIYLVSTNPKHIQWAFLNTVHCTALLCDYYFPWTDLYDRYIFFETISSLTPRAVVTKNILTQCHPVWINFFVIFSLLSESFVFLNEGTQVIEEYHLPNTIMLDSIQYDLYESFFKYQQDHLELSILYSFFENTSSYHLKNILSNSFFFEGELDENFDKNLSNQVEKLNIWWDKIMAKKRNALLNNLDQKKLNVDFFFKI